METQNRTKKLEFAEKMFEVDTTTGKLIPLPLFVKQNTDTQKENIKISSLRSETKCPLEPLDFKKLFAENSRMSSRQTKRRTGSSIIHSEDPKMSSLRSETKITRHSLQSKRRTESKMETHNRTKKLKFTENMFEVDPTTGKLIPLPIFVKQNTDTQKEVPKIASLPSETKVPLEPLDFKKLFADNSKLSSLQTKRRIESPNFNSDSNELSSKIRKLETTPHSARRLFQSNKYQNPRLSRSRNSTSMTMKSTKSSPLLNLEEVEQNLLNNRSTLRNYPFKSPDMPSFKFTKLTNSQSKSKKLEVPQIILEESETFIDQLDNEDMAEENEPRTPDSSQEFNNLEQLCKDSPVTSVCNLMQGTMIDSAKRKKRNLASNSDLVKHIEELIREEEIRHQQNISMLNTVLILIGKFTETEKENNSTKTNRRSERLLNKSPIIQKDKLLTSPAILKSGDLRKNTLKKNFAAKSLDYQIVSSSSRTQKAMELYNSLKSRSEFLETPKSDRKNLSARLQDQCFLLQDTPVHK